MMNVMPLLREAARWLVRGACACACLAQLSCAFGEADAVGSLFEDDKDPLLVAVGTDTAGNYSIHSSLTGGMWTTNLVTVAEPGTLQFAMYGNDLFMTAGGSPNCYMSNDGFLWGRASTGGASSSDPEMLFDGVYADGRYVVVGYNVAGYASAYASADGIIWANSNLNSRFSGSLSGIAYGNGMFVAVGTAAGYNSFIAASADGIVWTGNLMEGATSAVDLYGVAYGNGIFVAVGSGGRATASPDGIAWSDFYSIGNDAVNINGIAYGRDRFVAVGNMTMLGYGGIYLSYDGFAWTSNVNRSGVMADFQDVTCCHGTFVAVALSGNAAFSRQGLVWNASWVNGSGSLYGVTCRP